MGPEAERPLQTNDSEKLRIPRNRSAQFGGMLRRGKENPYQLQTGKDGGAPGGI